MGNETFELILYSGNSKSSAMEALQLARQNDFDGAQDKLKDAQEQLVLAHEIQTKMLVKHAQGEEQPVDILMVHAQDHLNGAMTTLDLATEIIAMYEILKKGEAAL